MIEATNCLTCKRTMIPGEVFANGFDDGPTLCHACKKVRNDQIAAELIYTPENGMGNEETEGIGR